MKLVDLINKKIAIGQVFKNPRKGTSIIVSITDKNITYKRGNSNISIKLDDIDRAYMNFKNQKCSSKDLKEFNKHVFSSENNGHNCNCSFLFLILNYLGLSSEIMGSGNRGDSYYVNIF